MSRIGRQPIDVPAGVTVTFTDGVISVKGPKGTLTQAVADQRIGISQEGAVITVTRASEDKKVRAMHGLYRALLANMIQGVTQGFEKRLIIQGVGYKATQDGNNIVLNVGFSHPVPFQAPEGVKLEVVSATEIAVSGISKEAVGQTASNIRCIKKPEPYHCYGIRYKDEVIQRKEGKTAGK
ncbi:MAG: 50S ribosomal protein L6 [Clostridia bacterium]|nr:50S ribosomal protein L6 [Clostridia bacterium]